MELSLHDRIYRRVQSEIPHDDPFCEYLAEICADPNSHTDDLHDIVDTMFQTTYPNMSETRRRHFIYALLDLIEADRDPSNKSVELLSSNDDEIDQAEKVERDGECKLCGCHQRITSNVHREKCNLCWSLRPI